MRYLDTSLIVAALTAESDTWSAQRSLAEAPAEPLLISDWVVTEFAGALAAKLRAGKLDPNEADVAARAFSALEAESFTRISVTDSDFASAAGLASSREVALRAGDALHLAVARAADATVYTLDKGLHRAAAGLQLPSVLVASADMSGDDD